MKKKMKAKKCPCPECGDGIHRTLPAIREVDAIIREDGELVELKSTKLKTVYAYPSCKEGEKKEKIIMSEEL